MGCTLHVHARALVITKLYPVYVNHYSNHLRYGILRKVLYRTRYARFN